MTLLVRNLVLLILVFWSGALCAQSIPTTDAEKLKAQADDLADKGAQAIDDGNMDQGLDDMVRAIQLDPTPMRHMIYGSVLFGNGVAVFKDSDQNKGVEILHQAEAQLRKAIAGFNPNKDQVYLGQCYFLLGEMYLNAFGDKDKAREYYKQSVELNDYPGARDALDRMSS
jgi:tetratricopeptide (TPR) repeat protein